MFAVTKNFWNSEYGNSVIDWMFFGAGAISLGFAVISTFLGS